MKNRSPELHTKFSEQISYEVHKVYNGEVKDEYYSPEAYSQYYKNGLQYSKQDAVKHALELQEEYPDETFVVIETVVKSMVVGRIEPRE